MAFRQRTIDFPTWAAPFNNLAYNLYRAGDRVMSNSTYAIASTELAVARTLAARVK